MRDQHGTSITLHLKPADPEDGIEDYTDKWILARTVKRYSDFVIYPIVYQDIREEVEKSETGQPKAGDLSAGVSLTKSPLPFFLGFAQPPWNV